jgi:hypothetical protein
VQIAIFQKAILNGRGINTRMVILTGMLTIIFLLLFTDTSGAYGRIITGLISQSLRKQGWVFDVRTPSLWGLSLSGDSLVTRWPNGPIFAVDKPSLSIDTLPLLGTTIQGHLGGDVYEGPLRLDFSHTLISRNQTLDGGLQNVKLGQIPFLRTYGIHSGLATVLFKEIKLKDSLPFAGNFSLLISEFRRSKNHVNPLSPEARDARLVNFALDTVAADLEVSMLEAEAEFKQDMIKFTSIKLLSSLGNASSTGSIKEVQTSPGVDMDIQIILTEKGKQLIGPLLALVPGAPKLAESNQARIDAKLSGPLSKPRWLFVSPKL